MDSCKNCPLLDSYAVEELTTEIDRLAARLAQGRRYNIGFPGATDFDYSALSNLLTTELLNNVGDPYCDGAGHNHTKAMEREVVRFCANLFRAPSTDYWGYVTGGGTEGNLHALRLARSQYPDAVVYYTDAAHYSNDKAVSMLMMDSVRIRTDRLGQMDYADLSAEIARRRQRAAVVIATIGTTMTEAVDDVRRIVGVLDAMAVRRRFIHSDAALSGVPLGLLDPAQRPGFDFGDGTDSIAISGHKFLGSPLPCGVVIHRASATCACRPISYTASPDTTITGSRAGHAALILWYALKRHGLSGHRQRAVAARELAKYTHQRLTELGWEAYRHEHAFTVVMRTPPESICSRWVLASQAGFSHLITMPGVTRDRVDSFVADMASVLAGDLDR